MSFLREIINVKILKNFIQNQAQKMPLNLHYDWLIDVCLVRTRAAILITSTNKTKYGPALPGVTLDCFYCPLFTHKSRGWRVNWPHLRPRMAWDIREVFRFSLQGIKNFRLSSLLIQRKLKIKSVVYEDKSRSSETA